MCVCASDCCAQPPGSVQRAAPGITRHALHLGQNVYIILSWAESITATTSNYLIQIHSILQSTHILLVHILQCESLSHTCSLFTIVPWARARSSLMSFSLPLCLTFHSAIFFSYVRRSSYSQSAHGYVNERTCARVCVRAIVWDRLSCSRYKYNPSYFAE